MILVKHTKYGDIGYVSHVDTMRVMLRTLARTGIGVKYSEGYNPHPLVNLSHPLPLGIQSECEYVCFNNLTGKAADFAKLFDASSPSGIQCIYAIDVDNNPNVAGKVAYADYTIAGDYSALSKQIDGINKADSYVITYLHKGIAVTEDIKPKLKSISTNSQGISMCLATGNPTLRPDRLATHLNEKFALNIATKYIKRTVQYVNIDGKLVEMDEYIKRFEIR